MYILTNTDNVIMHISETLKEENGQYLINNEHLAIPKEFKMQDIDGNIVVEKVNMYKVNEIPNNVKETKYCYTEKDGFYKNQN